MLVAPELKGGISAGAIRPIVFDHRPAHGAQFLLVTVSPEGKVVRCTTKMANGLAYENPSNCLMVKSKRFSAARDLKGDPVYALTILTIEWSEGKAQRYFVDDPGLVVLGVSRMPSGTTTSTNARADFMIDSLGKVESCTIGRSSGNPVLDRLACAGTASTTPFNPVLDGEGSPIRSLQSRQVFFQVKAQVAPKDR